MKDDRLYLRHMLDAIERIERYAATGEEAFMADSHWQDAVIRQLEILGEAAKRISPSLRAGQSQIPWRRIAGLRDVLIHDYLGVDISAVWRIVTEELPALREQITRLVHSRAAEGQSNPQDTQ